MPTHSEAMRKFKHVSGKVIASIFGVDKALITRMTNEGMPRNDDKTYDVDKCVQWRCGNRSLQSRDLKEQKLAKEVERMEAQIDQMRERVIPRVEHDEIMCARASSLRRFLENTCMMNARYFVGLSLEEARVQMDNFTRDAMIAYTGQRTKEES